MELYIHIPFCVKKCEYCDFTSGAYDAGVRRDYTSCLISELQMYAPDFSEESFETVYIGGGTPSWLETEYMEQILICMHKCFHIDPEAEISMEINPGTASSSFLNMIKAHGVDRLSIGLQSANDNELAALGRIHNFDRFLHTYEMARHAGFYDINIDIMTGIPGQDERSLGRTLSSVIRLKPEHISSYALIIEEGTPFYKKYAGDLERQRAGEPTLFLPDEDMEYRLYKLSGEMLCDAGYERYEISNFARPGYECIHNIGYWRRIPYLGVGLSAASFYGDHRYTNVSNMEVYFDLINSGRRPIESASAISRNDAMAEFMYLGLRMSDGIARSDFYQSFDMDIEARYGAVIKPLIREGLLISSGGRLYLSDRGRDISNQVLYRFL